MKGLQFLWRCCERSWTVSGPDLRNACIETKAILRVLFSKHKFSNWHKTKWLFICFSFMTNKQIKNSCVNFFNVLKFSRFLAQPCTLQTLRLSQASVKAADSEELDFLSSKRVFIMRYKNLCFEYFIDISTWTTHFTFSARQSNKLATI